MIYPKVLISFTALALLIQLTVAQKGWTVGEGTEKDYIANGEAVNFEGAEAFCLKVKGQLPKVTSAEENAAIRKMLPSNFGIWLGIKRGSDRYVWLDNSELLYNSWYSSSSGYNGAHMSSDSRWYVTTYSSKYYVVCERPYDQPAKEKERSQQQITEWSYGHGTEKQYLIFGNQSFNFQFARRSCHQVKGQLPQINNIWENLAVRKMLPSSNSIWLGARNPGLNGQRYGQKFAWMDGSALKYTHWTSAPEFSNDGLMMDADGNWKAGKYGAFNFVVCERTNQYAEENERNELISKFEALFQNAKLRQITNDRKIRLLENLNKELSRKLAALVKAKASG